MIVHKQLADGSWQALTLAEQLGNIGSEVHRIQQWRGRDASRAERAFERALELLDLTLADRRWQRRLKEIARAREELCRVVTSGDQASELGSLDRYFTGFAVSARATR